MPADDRVRGDDDEGLLPSRPKPSESQPENLLDKAQPWARSLRVKREQLLSKGEVLQDKVCTGSKAVANAAEKMIKRCDHGI